MGGGEGTKISEIYFFLAGFQLQNWANSTFWKKIISMFLFSRTHNLSYFPSERRNLLYIITNGQEKWAALVPRVIEYSLSCNVSEYLGCLFPVFYLLGRCFSVRFRFAASSSILAPCKGNQQQVGTHRRKMTHTEVNIRITQELLGS